MLNTHDFAPIYGKYIILREAQIEDSAFILSLRTDPDKSAFLNKTENDINKQIDYMKNYKNLPYEWYFIIEKNTATTQRTHIDSMFCDNIESSATGMYPKIGVISIYPNNVFPLDSTIKQKWLNQYSIISDQAKAISSGRWIMLDSATYLEVLESVYLIREILFYKFCIDFEPFTVRGINKKVLSFHKIWGSNIVHEDNGLLFLELSKDNFMKNKTKFEKILEY